jgi:hypothetical protein
MGNKKLDIEEMHKRTIQHLAIIGRLVFNHFNGEDDLSLERFNKIKSQAISELNEDITVDKK